MSKKNAMRNDEMVIPELPENGRERPVCLYKRNNHAKSHNDFVLSKMQTEGATSTSFDRVTGRSNNTGAIRNLYKSVADDNNTAHIKNMNLLWNLQLRITAYYMLVTNLNTSDGLVNGATGHLRKIDYGTNNGIQKTLRLWIEFDDKTTGKLLSQNQVILRRYNNILDTWTMLEKVTSPIAKDTQNRIQLHRSQFPIVPAEAITVHKSQGSTYTDVLVNQYKK